MIDTSVLQAIRALIDRANTILCVSHVGPDGDAVGSLLGMWWMLRALGKEAVAALQDPVPDGLLLVPGIDRIVGADRTGAAFDLIICLDASSADRMGRVVQTDVHGHSPLLVIDHHVTNTRFGTLNWVEPRCAATCQMLVYLAEALGVSLQGELAVCLLTGLVTDTLCFRTPNTDADVLTAATKLVQGGADLADITAQTLNRRKFSTLQLLGLVLPHVTLADHVIWATVDRDQIAATGDNGQDDLQLSSMLISTVEADISATFTEKLLEDGRPAVECSFRAKPGFDVSQIAYELGGGGHPAASGCTLPGPLPEIRATIVPLLQAARRVQAAQSGHVAHGN